MVLEEEEPRERVARVAAGERVLDGAEVTRVDVASRMDLGASGYEKIVGTS